MSTMQSATHWTVRMNRRNRSVFFALLFVVLATYLPDISATPLHWALLAMQLLVYPQLVYWRALHSPDPVKAELQNLLIDGVLLGIWIGVWGLPLWIAFTVVTAVSINLMVFEAFRGLLKAILALSLGVTLAALAGEPHLRPATGNLTTGLCMMLLTAYIWNFSYGAYARGLELRDHRSQLRMQLDEITALQAKLEEQARRDPLSGLFNRRHLDEMLPRTLENCRRQGIPLALVMLDIDHFKSINDNYGHLAGDAFIRALAALLLQHVRLEDIACRYGGEEFLLMLPDMTLAKAGALSESLRQQCHAMEVVHEGLRIRTTLSFGVTAYPQHDSKYASGLVHAADQALYAAKMHGRNRTVLSTQLHADRLQPAEL